MANTEKKNRILIDNRRARYEYLLLDRYETGIALLGSEVKSLRAGKANLQDAHVRIERGNAKLFGCHISPYLQANRNNHEPLRPRQLLLHRHQLQKLEKGINQKGMTIIPTKIYLSGSNIKVEIALVKGKKLHDKRASMKERTAQREIDRNRK